MAQHRIFTTKFSKVYPLYVQKAERKNRTKAEVDRVICWLTGYSQAELQQQIDQEIDFETFFARAPAINPGTALIKGVVCGVRVEEVEDPLGQRGADALHLGQVVDGRAADPARRSKGV